MNISKITLKTVKKELVIWEQDLTIGGQLSIPRKGETLSFKGCFGDKKEAFVVESVEYLMDSRVLDQDQTKSGGFFSNAHPNTSIEIVIHAIHV